MSETAEASSSKPSTATFFKKPNRSRPASSRKRSESPEELQSDTVREVAFSHDETSGPSSSSVVRPSKANSSLAPFVQGTKRSREKEREKTKKMMVELEWKADESWGDQEERRRGFVTRSRDWDLDDASKDKPTEGDILAGDDAERGEDGSNKRQKADIDGMYHGASAYSNYITPRESTNSKIRAGPIKATSNIRSVTVVDYQPDVCKDYKETGFCGYGDSCKFLHDRGDYLAGWQLDKLAVNPTTGRTVEEEDSSDDEDVPFACLICRQPFTDPIVTKCGHYFCMTCALKRFAKTPKCYACGAPTGGLFNKAEKILAKMNAAKTAKAEARKRDMFGELKSDGEDDSDEGGIQFDGEPQEEHVEDDEEN